jgi:hypothetical protein
MIETSILLAIIIGLTEAIKRIGLKTKYAPLFAIALSLGLTFVTMGATTDSLIAGLVVGLTSVGLYSGVKTTLTK